MFPMIDDKTDSELTPEKSTLISAGHSKESRTENHCDENNLHSYSLSKHVSQLNGTPPPGLEYLAFIDELLIHQQVELFEVFTGWETKNRYKIKNSVGQQVFFASEESGMCSRQCCGHQRSFIVHITDNRGVEVARVIRQMKLLPLACCCLFHLCKCCQPSISSDKYSSTEIIDCQPKNKKKNNVFAKFLNDSLENCSQSVVVEAPPGVEIGRVYQRLSCNESKFEVLTPEGKPVLLISGKMSCCETLCCEGSQEFSIYSMADKSLKLGSINKLWTGFMREMFTDADNFSLTC
ncbi:hypothetical protein Ciccas_010886 [Cichlidogyrus casuarinus]|uniref:Phospholipid scramblase n=1 Tax=Cichlidogyrus casuarinus TaxID=1844966 RepID=A0ABD2PSX6_9PLAT